MAPTLLLAARARTRAASSQRPRGIGARPPAAGARARRSLARGAAHTFVLAAETSASGTPFLERREALTTRSTAESRKRHTSIVRRNADPCPRCSQPACIAKPASSSAERASAPRPKAAPSVLLTRRRISPRPERYALASAHSPASPSIAHASSSSPRASPAAVRAAPSSRSARKGAVSTPPIAPTTRRGRDLRGVRGFAPARGEKGVAETTSIAIDDAVVRSATPIAPPAAVPLAAAVPVATMASGAAPRRVRVACRAGRGAWKPRAPPALSASAARASTSRGVIAQSADTPLQGAPRGHWAQRQPTAAPWHQQTPLYFFGISKAAGIITSANDLMQRLPARFFDRHLRISLPSSAISAKHEAAMLRRALRLVALAALAARGGAAPGSVAAAARARYACKRFDPSRPIAPELVRSLAATTALAPSSFNVQPWACVLVQEGGAREALARGMLAANGERVREAPLVAVFAADLRSSHRVPAAAELARASGAPAEYVGKLPFYVSLFASGYRWGWVRWPMFVAKRLAMLLVGLFRAVPKLSTPETWAVKSTMLAAQTLMLAAAEEGLASLPMEGLDERRVRRALGIPRRYAIPCAIAIGYATPDAAARPRAGRFPLAELFRADGFGRPFAQDGGGPQEGGAAPPLEPAAA